MITQQPIGGLHATRKNIFFNYLPKMGSRSAYAKLATHQSRREIFHGVVHPYGIVELTLPSWELVQHRNGFWCWTTSISTALGYVGIIRVCTQHANKPLGWLQYVLQNFAVGSCFLATDGSTPSYFLRASCLLA